LFAFINHYFQKTLSRTNMSALASQTLPVLPSLKVSGNTVYVGDPKQLVDLLSSEVAQAVIEVHRTKGNMPLYKCKLRCKTLFQGNLDVAILIDFPNVPISTQVSAVNSANEEAVFSVVETAGAIDLSRALRFQENFKQAIDYWGSKMEDEVVKVYTDKTPKQIGDFPQHGKVVGKINVFQGRPFDSSEFLHKCLAEKALPAFKISYGWIGSTEDNRSEEHIWGFKFEMSIFPQYTAPKKSLEGGKKKRKAEVETPSEIAVAVAESVLETESSK
jgi:hypothetical protein